LRLAALPSRKDAAVLAPNQNIENNPMQSKKVSLAWMLSPQNILTRQANHLHFSNIAQLSSRPWRPWRHNNAVAHDAAAR
jgi:hypothetical protein